MKNIQTLQSILSPVLKPLSWVYGSGMRVREQMFQHGLFHSWTPKAVTISIGNIGWGGTGKTPLAGWLLGWAQKNKKTSMLLTRGYKSHPVSYPFFVHPNALAEEAGDEPLMLAQEHPEAHIIVDPIRKRAGRIGQKKFHPELIVLDDGFQHMAVKRHLNLVLLKPEDLADQWKAVIPAGSWREPLAALRRADAFAIKTGPDRFPRILSHFQQLLGHLKKPLFSFQVIPTQVRNVLDGTRQPDLGNAKYLLITGVGSPAQVQNTATRFLGYAPTHHVVYPDHHSYTKNDVLKMQALAKKLKCTSILCTPKDAVKLGPLCSEDFWQLDLRIQFGASSLGKNSHFDAWWGRQYKQINQRLKHT